MVGLNLIHVSKRGPQYKDVVYMYDDSHYKDLHNGNAYAWRDGFYIETGPYVLEKHLDISNE